MQRHLIVERTSVRCVIYGYRTSVRSLSRGRLTVTNVR